jgi:hypothetical protein
VSAPLSSITVIFGREFSPLFLPWRQELLSAAMFARVSRQTDPFPPYNRGKTKRKNDDGFSKKGLVCK